jgi:hypothetical protein
MALARRELMQEPRGRHYEATKIIGGARMAEGEFRNAYMKHPIFHTLCLGWLIICVVVLFQMFFPRAAPADDFG